MRQAWLSDYSISITTHLLLLMKCIFNDDAINNILQNQRRDVVKLYGKQILWNNLYFVSIGATAKTH